MKNEGTLKEPKKLKTLFHILVGMAIILVIFIYFDSPVQENDLITGSNKNGQLIPVEREEVVEAVSIFTRPKEGVSTLIGKPAKEVKTLYGNPTRIDPSIYGYDWWVYNNSFSDYLLIGVRDDKVIQAFAIGNKVDTAPYKIGQSLEDIYRFTLVQSEITMSIGENTYIFSLNEEDIKTRLLVQFDDLFAMLYIDQKDQQLEAVRFSDSQTLLLHKPYDILYSGDVIESKTPSSNLQARADKATAIQVVEMTNIIRLRHGLHVLESDMDLQNLANIHSEEMAKNNIARNESFEIPNFKDKLKETSLNFSRAGGNTAAFYFDAGEAVNGWLNSKDHRQTLLDRSYTHTGVGVYSNYYTQNFIEKKENLE